MTILGKTGIKEKIEGVKRPFPANRLKRDLEIDGI